jgi:hypothetical protein
LNRRERLMATLRGEPVDRPPVSFYELNGLDEKTGDSDPYNIYNHPSWKPLLDLAREKTDRIVMRGVPFLGAPPDPWDEITTTETWSDGGSLYRKRTIRFGKRALTEVTRRDPDVNTIWQIEPLFKGPEDVETFLTLPAPHCAGRPDPSEVLAAEDALGDSGIVMIDTADPLCIAASLFEMGEYTVVASTEPALFHRLLEWFASGLLPQTEEIARALPGRLWRIYGPEYASAPYLHPRQFHEYATRYNARMVESIHRYGGFARIHSHGRLRAILDDIVSTGCMGLDPIEPPPQGDVALSYVRERYGQQLVLFGNLELSDIEGLPEDEFGRKVIRALREGTSGKGRGFVLMPSSCPYGRILAAHTLMNYEKIIELVEQF